MFRHTDHLQFDAKPEKPDPVYAHKLQELIGGAYGEMTVTMQYLFQGWSCRMPGKYKDLIMDVATEEMGHVEMIATMVARLLEGAPATATAKAAAADPVVGAVMGGMDPQQAIVAGGGPLLADSNGYPWNGRYIVASGNLLADFRANAAAEAQGRVQTARLYNMTDDPGVRDMLKFNLARDTLHQNLWLKAIEELQADGLETTVAPNALFDEEYAEHATSVWHLSDGTAGHEGSWAAGPQPDGMHEFGYLLDPEPLGGPGSAPAPDPKLYATYDGKQGEPSGPALGTETGLAGKSEVGPQARCRCRHRSSPASPLPHPPCDSRRNGRSACLARWSAAAGCRCRGPWGRDVAAAVAVARHLDAGGAGEHDPVAGEPPPLVAEATAEFFHPETVLALVLAAYPAHQPQPGEAVDGAEHRLGHSVPEVVRPARQGSVQAADQLVEILVAG